jgi:ribosomal-protein-alanine N-acetyltransferase
LSITTRLVTRDDVPAVASLLAASRESIAPWDPIRPDDYYTEAGQREVIGAALESHQRGAAYPCVILDSGRIIGRINLNTMVRGPFQSSSVGYWVAAGETGRGVATAAVAHLAGVAFGELGLHRLEAGTLVHNVASQRVLERNGFVRFGLAPQYLSIAGRWQDHVLFQLLNPAA